MAFHSALVLGKEYFLNVFVFERRDLGLPHGSVVCISFKDGRPASTLKAVCHKASVVHHMSCEALKKQKGMA